MAPALSILGINHRQMRSHGVHVVIFSNFCRVWCWARVLQITASNGSGQRRATPVVMRVISDRQWPNETGAPDPCALQPLLSAGFKWWKQCQTAQAPSAAAVLDAGWTPSAQSSVVHPGQMMTLLEFCNLLPHGSVEIDGSSE
jgi:hypothetical protein